MPRGKSKKECKKDKIKLVMHEFKQNKLKIGKSNKKVSNYKQALAIALSVANKYCNL